MKDLKDYLTRNIQQSLRPTPSVLWRLAAMAALVWTSTRWLTATDSWVSAFYFAVSSMLAVGFFLLCVTDVTDLKNLRDENARLKADNKRMSRRPLTSTPPGGVPELTREAMERARSELSGQSGERRAPSMANIRPVRRPHPLSRVRFDTLQLHWPQQPKLSIM